MNRFGNPYTGIRLRRCISHSLASYQRTQNGDLSNRQFVTKIPNDKASILETVKNSVNFSDTMKDDVSEENAYEHYSKDGKLIHRQDGITKVDENFDWVEFERAFGIDCDSVNVDDAQLKETIISGDDDSFLNGGLDLPLEVLKNGVSYSGIVQIEDKEKIDETATTKPDSFTTDQNHVEDDKIPNFEDIVTRKRVRDKKRRQFEAAKSESSHELPVSNSRNHSYPKSESKAVVGALQVPVDGKRPGYERRVRGLEWEMEKVIVRELDSNERWQRANATIYNILLSPNLQSLTILYETDNGLLIKDGKKIAKHLRSIVAKNVSIKYVPNVFLEHSSKQKHRESVLEVDDLFQKIQDERRMNDDIRNNK